MKTVEFRVRGKDGQEKKPGRISIDLDYETPEIDYALLDRLGRLARRGCLGCPFAPEVPKEIVTLLERLVTLLER